MESKRGGVAWREGEGWERSDKNITLKRHYTQSPRDRRAATLNGQQ